MIKMFKVHRVKLKSAVYRK